MIESVRVQNFQSLRDVALELAPLTVIVGRSSSGKSAFTRAMKTLTSNARGTSYITHGERTCTISAQTDKGTVSLTKGSKDEYALIPSNSEKKIFTKLAAAVPEDISQFIGIPAKDPLNYSSQFDMPYLLTSTAGEVARTLGELTNVHVIFEAAREANRQRLTHSQTLKTRAADLQSVTTDLESFADLTARREALTAAAEAHKNAVALSQQLFALQELISRQSAAQRLAAQHTISLPDLGSIERASKRLTRLRDLISTAQSASDITSREISALPDIQKISTAAERLSALRMHIRLHKLSSRALFDAEHEAADAQKEFQQLTREHDHTLRDAGTCPTCGQSTAALKG